MTVCGNIIINILKPCAAVSAGSSIIVQKSIKGKIDWGDVGVSALFGAVGGAFALTGVGGVAGQFAIQGGLDLE